MDEVVFHMVDLVIRACPRACNRAAICTLLHTCIHAFIDTTIVSTTKHLCTGSVVLPAFHRSLQGLLVCRSNAANTASNRCVRTVVFTCLCECLYVCVVICACTLLAQYFVVLDRTTWHNCSGHLMKRCGKRCCIPLVQLSSPGSRTPEQ